MATKFLEPGGDATFDISLWPINANSPSAVSDFVHGAHLRSTKFRPNVADQVKVTGGVADAGGRMSFYLYLNALPTGATTVPVLLNSATLTVISLNINASGQLQFGNNVGNVGAAGSSLTTGKWYRIAIAWTVSSTSVNQMRLWLNGRLDITNTNVTLSGVSMADFFFGNTIPDTTLDMRLSDFYLDNLTTLTDPGDIWVVAKRPNANGSTVEFTTQIGAGGSGYGSGHSPQVNERAISGTNGWSISTTTRKTEQYSIEGKGVGDFDISAWQLIDYMGWMYAGVDSVANSPVHRIILANVLTAKTMATSPNIFTQIAGSIVYPAGSTDIGLDAQYTTTPHLTSLYECGVIVAGIPPIPARFVGMNRNSRGIQNNQAVNRAYNY